MVLVAVELFDFFMNALQDGVGVVAFLQQDDAFDGVGIVDDRGRRLGDVARPIWPRRILGPCSTVPMSLILMARRWTF